MSDIVATERGASKIFHTARYYKEQMPLAWPDCLCSGPLHLEVRGLFKKLLLWE